MSSHSRGAPRRRVTLLLQAFRLWARANVRDCLLSCRELILELPRSVCLDSIATREFSREAADNNAKSTDDCTHALRLHLLIATRIAPRTTRSREGIVLMFVDADSYTLVGPPFGTLSDGPA
jgi:hypothetical protein